MKVIKVGRSSENDIVISNDGYVGRAHCEFIQDDSGNYWVIDLNSTNGTFVNGVRCLGKTRLNSTDMVRIGNTMLPWKNYFSGFSGNAMNAGTQINSVGGGYNPPAVNQAGGGYNPPVVNQVISGGYNIPYNTPYNSQSKPPIVEESPKGSGFGVASFVLGLLGASLLAIIFGAISIGRDERTKGLGIAGLILGIIWFIIIVIAIIASSF